MKKLLPFIFYSLYLTTALGQDGNINRIASLSKFGQYIHPLLEAKHQSIYKHELEGIKEDFGIVTTFQIDTQGAVINLNIKNHTSSIKVEEYISKLVMSTNKQ